MIEQAVAFFGTEEADPKGRILTAGPLSVEFQNGQLRYARVGGIEIMRAIAFILRDESWGTYDAEILNLVIDEGADGFRVAYDGRCADGAVVYSAEITGRGDGLVFAARVRTTAAFRTNRTGFVILHPLAGCAGEPVEVEHVDGHRERARFPATIGAYQPFFAVRSLRHEFAPGAFVTARLEGDTFEMEDQRNWSDASFKTYVRPIGLPWPYELPAGAEFEQRVNLRIEGNARSRTSAVRGSGVTTVTIGAVSGKMPVLGVEIPAEEAAASLAQIDLLQALGPRLIIGEVKQHLGHGQRELAAYREIAAACAAELTIEGALRCAGDPKAEAAELAEDCAASGVTPAAVTLWARSDLKGVLPGSAWPVQPPLEAIRWAALTAFPRARIGGGAHAFFTELNRRRPLAHFLDYISFTTTPIVHAADDRSVMETLETLPFIAASARAIAQGKPWRVGPSTIGTRDNPYGAGPTPNPRNGRVCMAEMDPRQRGIFAAAWTVGYLAAFAAGGAEAIVLGTATGPRGAIYRRMDHAQPWYDAQQGRLVYPVFHVARAAARAGGQDLLATISSAPRAVAALGWRGGDGATELLLANLTGAAQQVTLDGMTRTRIRRLDEASFAAAATDADWTARPGAPAAAGPIGLPPYAVAFVATAG